MERNEKLAVAATLINELMKHTTDTTRMDVVVDADEINLYNKPGNSPVFYHSEQVADIVRTLGLSHWINVDMADYRIKIRVHIH